MKKRPAKPSARPAQKQQLPTELVGDLLGAIRHQFYTENPAAWFKDQRFILDRVILWPATWLDGRGITLPALRYKELILEVLQEIKQHGNTGKIAYWPAYLAKCVQERFKHRSDHIYEEGKALRNLTENTLLSLSNFQSQQIINNQSVDPIRALAAARRDLLAQNRAKRPSKKEPQQLGFDLIP